MKTSWQSLVFVLIQFSSLGYIALTGSIFPDSILLLVIELAGLFLGVWAVLTMRIGYFNIAPEPLDWAKLVSYGPYRVIRHPMYLALLITSIPLVIDTFNYFRLSVLIILFFNMLLKMQYEEKLLVKKFTGYDKYIQETSKIVPCIF